MEWRTFNDFPLELQLGCADRAQTFLESGLVDSALDEIENLQFSQYAEVRAEARRILEDWDDTYQLEARLSDPNKRSNSEDAVEYVRRGPAPDDARPRRLDP